MSRHSFKTIYFLIIGVLMLEYFILDLRYISKALSSVNDESTLLPYQYIQDNESNAVPQQIIDRMQVMVESRELNNTPSTARILMYNNVPKCGSTSMVDILKGFQYTNNFVKRGSIYIFPRTKSKEQQVNIIEEMLVLNQSSHYFWASHAYFFDDVRDYNGLVTWMNIVRDPVERFISDFYFERQNTHPYTVKWMKIWGLDSKGNKELNLDQCAADGNPLCTWTIYPFGELQLSFFCGQDPVCSKLGQRKALHIAMNNVEKYYSVVGVTEERKLTYAVFEAYLPKYFRGLQQKLKGDVRKNVSTMKQPVLNETRSILKNNFKEDYEFYEFIKQRLYAQAEVLGIDANSD